VIIFRDFMDSNMDRTKHMLNYLYPIVGRANPELRDFMERIISKPKSYVNEYLIPLINKRRAHRLVCSTKKYGQLCRFVCTRYKILTNIIYLVPH
jgi:hypothetical protein